MNHPARDPIEEIRFFADLGLDFVDLTLEPPGASPWTADARQIRTVLDDLGLGVVGHTAYYLPLAHPFESVRTAAVDELRKCLDFFADLGVRWMNVHPDARVPFHEKPVIIEKNVRSLEELIEHGKGCGVGVMVENIPGDFNTAVQLARLLEPLPDLGLHLDIGHCNLLVEHNTTAEICARFGDRIKHAHLHDNNGGAADLHLPLGAGRMDVPKEVANLRATGYDDTITLEVFSADKSYLEHSRDVLRQLWTRGSAPGLRLPAEMAH